MRSFLALCLLALVVSASATANRRSLLQKPCTCNSGNTRAVNECPADGCRPGYTCRTCTQTQPTCNPGGNNCFLVTNRCLQNSNKRC